MKKKNQRIISKSIEVISGYRIIILLKLLVHKKLLHKNIVLYTKNHPIYSDFFNSRFKKYYFYTLEPSMYINWTWNNLIYKYTDIVHCDATHFNQYFANYQGKMVIECEARFHHYDRISKNVKAIIYQSQFAAALDGKGTDTVVYPAIQDYKKRRQTQNKIRLLAVGFGDYIKGYDVVLEVFSSLKKMGYPVELYIAGSQGHNFETYPEVSQEDYAMANFSEKYKYCLDNYEDFTMKPHRRSELLEEIYPASDIYLHFARMETFGFSVLEAMSFSLPVVTVDFKALPEMVLHGENGFICKVFDNEQCLPDVVFMNTKEWQNKAIEEGINYCRKLIEDPDLRRKMGQKSKEMTLTKFSPETRLSKLIDIYNL